MYVWYEPRLRSDSDEHTFTKFVSKSPILTDDISTYITIEVQRTSLHHGHSLNHYCNTITFPTHPENITSPETFRLGWIYKASSS